MSTTEQRRNRPAAVAAQRRKINRAITNARRRFPTICANGIYPFPIEGHAARLSYAKRGHFAPVVSGPLIPDQVAAAMDFLSMFSPTKTGRVDSYRLKHVAEDWARRQDIASGYISNGALIVAALAIGLVVEPCGPPWARSPNVMIGISEKSVRRMIVANDFVRREKAVGRAKVTYSIPNSPDVAGLSP